MRILVAAAAIVATLGAAPTDPFATFAPSVVVTDKDRRQLNEGDTVAHVLSAPKGQIAVFVAVPVSATPDRLVAWMHAIPVLKRSAQVPISRRFSNPPRLDDLDELVFDNDTLDDVRSCRVGDCALKLTAPEIADLHAVIRTAGSTWRPALQDAMRALVLTRVRAYIADGQSGMPPVEDGSQPILLHERFASVLRHSAFLVEHQPDLAAFLGRYPEPARCPVESFFYWSREELGRSPSFTVTHVVIARGDGEQPEVTVAGKQVFATRYTNASLGITSLVRDGDHRYLAYVNRTDVDALNGAFGGLIRWFVGRRLQSDAPDVLKGLRRRLESGDPPAS